MGNRLADPFVHGDTPCGKCGVLNKDHDGIRHYYVTTATTIDPWEQLERLAKQLADLHILRNVDSRSIVTAYRERDIISAELHKAKEENKRLRTMIWYLKSKLGEITTDEMGPGEIKDAT